MGSFRTGMLDASFTINPDSFCLVRYANMKRGFLLIIGDSDKPGALIVAVALDHLIILDQLGNVTMWVLTV
jgi:hypothetical protein